MTLSSAVSEQGNIGNINEDEDSSRDPSTGLVKGIHFESSPENKHKRLPSSRLVNSGLIISISYN